MHKTQPGPLHGSENTLKCFGVVGGRVTQRVKEVIPFKFKYLSAHKQSPQKCITRKEWAANLNASNAEYPRPQRGSQKACDLVNP